MPRDYLSRSLLPPRELVERWTTIAAIRDEDPRAYVARYDKLWRRILRTCKAQKTWDDRDVDTLRELVEWTRLADDHQREADDDAYQRHAESNRVYAHPGFRQALEARREARELARELLLTPEARALAGLDEPPSGDDGAGDQAGL